MGSRNLLWYAQLYSIEMMMMIHSSCSTGLYSCISIWERTVQFGSLATVLCDVFISSFERRLAK